MQMWEHFLSLVYSNSSQIKETEMQLLYPTDPATLSDKQFSSISPFLDSVTLITA